MHLLMLLIPEDISGRVVMIGIIVTPIHNRPVPDFSAITSPYVESLEPIITIIKALKKS